MYILGINGGVRLGYQDVAACLIKDGKVIFAVEEERLNRIKFSPGQLPERAIRQCLDFESISMKDIDIVASHGSTWGDAFKTVLSGYLNDNFGHCPELVFVHHHDAHAASAYYGSGFSEAMILTMDASGDGISTQLSVGKGNDLIVKKRYTRPHSLGIFYTMITQICGFRRDSDEYKLMGLSAYGDPDKYDLSQIINYNNNNFYLDETCIKTMKPGAPQPTKQEMIYSRKLTDFLGRRRLPGETIEQKHKDIAAAGQRQLENIVIPMIRDFYESTGIRKLCLAGGVAQNCLLNQKLMNLDFIDDIYVQPASSDAGISAGAAMFASVIKGIPVKPIHSAMLGMSYSDEEIEKALNHIKVKYSKLRDPAKSAAELLTENKIIAWFQGRMEFGPRALGNRSILANPSMPMIKDALNASIKY
ncbi:MAG: carbamoyl transferase, partial [Candidatus Delongbacteria bacterium]|nr:carbamoyl transferase [Candidatus Delongbacteria bacterium]